MVEKFGTYMEMGMGGRGERAPLEGPYLPRCACTLMRGSMGIWREDVWGITVERQLACLAAPHPNCVAVGTFQGSC